MTEAGDKPWYRHFWLWFVLAPVAAAVLASFATLIIAGAPPPLVVDDFGPIALVIEQDRERDLRAGDLGLAAELTFAAPAAGGAPRVTATLAGATPDAIRLRLIHPTREAMDRSALLTRAGGVYAGTLERPATRMYVQLTDEGGAWRLTGVIGPGQDSLAMRATPGS
jgi:hypothetical protein